MNEKLIIQDVLFEEKPDAVPYNYRISYKVAQLCLIISESCKRGGCSLLKLHMISTCMYTKRAMHNLLEFANDKLSENPLIRFDPATNRALNFALADELIEQQQNGSFKLSTKGKALVLEIKRNEILRTELIFLEDLSNKITEEKIKTLMNAWRYSDVDNKSG